MSYPGMVKLAGGVPGPVIAEDGTFSPTVKEIGGAVGANAKAIILNNPNNPSGVMYAKDFIREMVEFLREEESLSHHRRHQQPARIRRQKRSRRLRLWEKAPLEESKLVVINGVSKMYAMTGFCTGRAIANKPLIEAMTTNQSQQTSGPASASQWAAVGALNGVQSSIESLRVTLENNRNIMLDRLKALDGIKVHNPNGTFYCFPDFSAYMKASQKLISANTMRSRPASSRTSS